MMILRGTIVVAALLLSITLVAAPAAPAQRSNALGFSLLRKVPGTAETKNKFLSPLSAYVALSMALEGAEGETAAELRTLLQTGSSHLDDYRGETGEWMKALETRQGIKLRLANSLWTSPAFPVLPSFVAHLTKGYGAEAHYANFGNPSAAAKAINGWVSEKTGGKITSAVADPLTRGSVLYLVNTADFEAQWAEPFLPARSRLLPFHQENGTAKAVPTMLKTGSYHWVSRETEAAIEIPYRDHQTSLVAIVPRGPSLTDYTSTFDEAKWSHLTAAIDASPMRSLLLQLPKLALSYETSLIDALQEAGVKSAFGGSADFRAMTTAPNIKISDVKQKTALTIDEEGTKAAAATTVGFSVTASPIKPLTFAIDRPFLVVIRDRPTNTALFVGVIHQPVGGALRKK